MAKERHIGVFFDFGSVAKSQLSRKLLTLFLVIAVIEAAFTGFLAFGVMSAGKAAEQEFRVLALSQEAAGLLKLSRNAWLAGERAFYHNDKFGAYKAAFSAVQDGFANLSANMQKEGFSSTTLDVIQSSLQEMNRSITSRIQKGHSAGPVNRQEAQHFLKKSVRCYQAFLETVQDFQKMAKARASRNSLNIDAAYLLWGSALANVGLLILVALFLEREITRPIGGLIANCQFLEKRALMPRPTKLETEIHSLEQSFFEMSQTLNLNETRRQSYISLLRNVQEASLGRLSERIQVLASDAQLPPKVQKMYSSFSGNLKNMLRLVAGMSESLSTEQNGLTPRYETVSCSNLAEQARGSVDSLCRERQVTLDLETDEQAELELDQQLIGRVLLNFLSNAIKYSPHGGAIVLRAENPKQSVLSDRLPEAALSEQQTLFSVTDQGPGMTASNVEKLFNKFVQVDAVDGVKRAGTGLGLAICKDIVQAHGGTLGCFSEPGKGSIFWFSLPKQKSFVDASLMAPSEGEPTAVPNLVPGNSRTFPQSIKRSFVSTLLIFVLGQFGIALVLGYNFQQASEKASTFAIKKRVVFKTQELLGNWLVWNRKMMSALMTMNFQLVQKITPLLDENVDRAEWLIAHTKDSAQVQERLILVRKNFLRFVRVSDKAVASSKSISQISLMMLAQQGQKLATATDRDIFDCLELEKSDVDTAYEWSEDLRKNLVLALAASAVLHAILLVYVANSSFLILNRIAVLKRESEDFAIGKDVLPILEGKDELSFLELRLYQTSKALKQAETDRQVLVATINHDLRTPVNSVLAGFEMIQEGVFGEPDIKQKPLLATCVGDLLGLVRQINNLLLLEKIESGTYKMVHSQLEIEGLLNQAVENLKTESSSANVCIELHNGCSQALTVVADEQLLLEMFKAVLLNAIEAAPSASDVVVNLNRISDQIRVSIRDSGPGISHELLPSIFNRFRFVDGKAIAGLGLPLASAICKLHQCQIAFVYSTSREGTCIEITLPISTESSEFQRAENSVAKNV